MDYPIFLLSSFSLLLTSRSKLFPMVFCGLFSLNSLFLSKHLANPLLSIAKKKGFRTMKANSFQRFHCISSILMLTSLRNGFNLSQSPNYYAILSCFSFLIPLFDFPPKSKSLQEEDSKISTEEVRFWKSFSNLTSF